MKTMNLSWLEDFLVLSASGNFSRAADERHMTQPAFSRRIRALEEWLGAELFDRSSQPATLTATGKWLTTVAQDMLTRAARLPAQARAIADADARALRIASTHALSFTFLPPWLRSMEQKLTLLGPVSLVADVLPRCEALLMQGHVHFVLCHSHPQAPCALAAQNYPQHVVGADRLVPVSVTTKTGRPKHELLSLKGGASLLGYGSESGIGRMLKAVKGQDIAALQLKSVVTAQTASVLKTMVLEGRGVAWLPRTLVADELERGVLTPAAPTDWEVELDVCLFRGPSPLSQGADDFWSGVPKRRQRHRKA